jgi:hypothetical protein
MAKIKYTREQIRELKKNKYVKELYKKNSRTLSLNL